MYINGEFVDDGLVRLEAAQIKQEMRDESPGADEFTVELEAREAAREAVIERVVLRQAAQFNGTPIPPAAIEAVLQKFREQAPQQAGCLLPRDEETLRAKIENELRIERLLAAVTSHIPRPGIKHITTFYQHAKQSITLPEKIHAAHIVKNIDESTPESEALAAIRQIQSWLREGRLFEQVADEHSDCPGRGGDLGFFGRGEMVAEFEDAVFALPVGAVSEIFRTPFGFHIAKVLARRAERVPLLREVRDTIESALWKEAKDQAVRAYLQELRAQADVRKSK